MDRSSLDKSLEEDKSRQRKEQREKRIKTRYDYAAGKSKIQNISKVERKLENTTKESEERIAQTFLEGKELITNIRVASDAREMERRKIEMEARNARLNKLETEAEKAIEKIKSITGKWTNHSSSDPLDLHQELLEQKDRCLELIEQKNQLIADFKWELKLADEKFMADREQMMDDIAILAKRIDEQVDVMKKAFADELITIEEAAELDRKEVAETQAEEWEALFEEKEGNAVSNLEKKLAQMERNEEEIRELNIKQEEHYRETKIRMENDVKSLEDELERIKAICLLNKEKLDYNYQILKKREAENSMIKTEQRRNINKLQDDVILLKKQIEEKKMRTKHELDHLQKEVCGLRRNLMDIEKKADYFNEINDVKYFQVWDLKTEEACDLLSAVLETDKLIKEEILGLVYTEPDVKPLKKDDLVSYQAAMVILNESLSKS